jgi:hypothetical protein
LTRKLHLITAKTLITRPNRVKTAILNMEIRALVLTARRMICRSLALGLVATQACSTSQAQALLLAGVLLLVLEGASVLILVLWHCRIK